MPRILIDTDALLSDGTLTPDLARILMARQVTGSRTGLMINLLLVLGALAVAAGVIALAPAPATGLALAVLALGGAGALRQAGGPSWHVLSQGLAIMGALGLAGWISAELWEAESAFWPPFVIFALLAGIAAWFRNAFLAALAVLAFGALLGTGTFYWHASYAIFVRESLISLLAFTAIAGGLYAARDRLPEAWTSLTTAAARTAAIIASFAFWVGSLWGDRVGEHWAAGTDWEASQAWRAQALEIPESAFSVGWAGALIACIVMTRRGGFLSTSAIVFLAIHAYTQFFETFGAEPMTLIVGGLFAVGIATWLGREFVRKQTAGKA